jgi:hypothetical protein
MVKVGDIVYVDTHLYLSHGLDDVIGGKAHVTNVYKGMSGGKMFTFIEVEEHPQSGYNWGQFLSHKQKTLAKEFGERWAKADPDTRPEFNQWD